MIRFADRHALPSRLTMREVEEAMGEPPPRDPAERDGYFRVVLDELFARVGADAYDDYVLLPGLLPPEVWDHVVAEAERESRRRAARA